MFYKALQLILYSAIPIVGILFFGWDWRQVIILYWLENIAVGIATLINMLTTTYDRNSILPDTVSQQDASRYLATLPVNPTLMKYSMAAFFALHYGGFTLIHGVFVYFLIHGGFGGMPISSQGLPDISSLLLTWVGLTVVQIVLLWRNRADATTQHPSLMTTMNNPYKRIIALQFGIILGAFAITWFNFPAIAALVLVIIHALLDLTSFSQRSLPTEAPIDAPDSTDPKTGI